MLQPLQVSLALRPQFQQLCKTRDTKTGSVPEGCGSVLTQQLWRGPLIPPLAQI